jgi:tripartite-type tricarboxylate transporter receptor subunit TctC
MPPQVTGHRCIWPANCSGGKQASNWRVDVMFNFVLSSLPLVRQGQLRGLAVLTANRLSVAPDLPTMAEAGVAGAEVSSWSAFLVPANTAQQVISKIHADTITALAAPTVRDKLEQGGAVLIGSSLANSPRS